MNFKTPILVVQSHTRSGLKGATGVTKSVILDAMECGQGTGASSPFGIWKIRRTDKWEVQASIPAEAPNLESDIAALIKEAHAALRQPDAGGLDVTRKRSV